MNTTHYLYMLEGSAHEGTEHRSCVKVEVAFLGFPSLNGLCGRKATLNLKITKHAEFKRCVKDEVAVFGSSSLIVCTVSADVKQH